MTEHRALCGWLLKQDAQTLWRGWKRRWFQQLHDYQLYYFPNCTTDVSLSKGFIDIKSIVDVQPDTTTKEKHVFNVITSERTYVLQAASEDEVSYWISGLKAIIANLSQPLATLITKAEIFEKMQLQQQQQQQQRIRSTTSKPGTPTKAELHDDRKARTMSMRIFPDVETAEKEAAQRSNSMRDFTRSTSMQNITYIEYADTPPPASPLKPEGADSANKHAHRNTPPAHSLSSVSAPASPAPSHAPALATTPQSTPTPPVPASPKSSAMSESEREKMENKKMASMRDLQALIVREKDNEISRLTAEVAKLTEIQEQAVEATKTVRQQYQEQIEKMRVDEHLRYSDLERRLTEQLDEANYALRKRDEECTNAVATMRLAVEENERNRSELAQIKQDMQQRVTILESEIKLKENIISQLNSNITSLNGELSAKDSLLENSMREIPYATAFDDVLMVAQLEKERETRHALQEQCAFLGQEVFKLETELKHQKILVEEQKNKILDRNSTQASNTNSPGSMRAFDATSGHMASNNTNNGNGSTSGNFNNVAEDNVQLKLLAMENKDLRQKYFMSVGRSLKLQTTMTGGYTNVSVADLYEQAINNNIKIENWPNWISDHLAKSLQSPT